MNNSLIFPLILSFFPGWLLILKNYDELIFQDILITASIVIITFGLWVIVKKIIGNENKSSLIIGAGVGFFFYFGYIQDALKGIIFLGIAFDKTIILISISTIIFILLTIYLLKTKRNLQPPIKIMNVVTITILIVVVIPMLIPNSFAENPNVYHIILDEYTDNEILMKKFGYNNSVFIEYLKQNNFIVPEKIFSISPSTPNELSSILNMEYSKSLGWVSDNYKKMNNNKVMSVFSENHYTIIETNSMMRYKNFSHVDENLCYNTNFINSEFLDQLLNKSIIRYFMEKHQENTRRDTVRCTFDALTQIPTTLERPTYVFAHLYVPHPPFLFGPNGESVTPDHDEISGLQSWENPEGYVNQLIYATSEVSKVIDNIIEKDPSAIIIIQGDTGTLTGTDLNTKKTFDDIYQAHSILYAIKINESINPQKINPVNTYRIIFNHIFDSNYDLLDTYNFDILENGEHDDITEKLKLHSLE
tara:strand:- start:286 stop:1710 length:1425 start_codon:yes stop_codon:yes gene_type:complete